VKLAEDQFTTSVIVPTVAGQRWVDMPEEFLVLRAVEWLPYATVVGGPLLTEGGEALLDETGEELVPEDWVGYEVTGDDRPEPLERFVLQERHRYLGVQSWTEGRPVAYRLVGTTSAHVERMEFVPTPSGEHPIRVWYVPIEPLLSADADTYNGRSGFEEWIVLDASVAILISEESDASATVQEREMMFQDQIAPIFAARDQNRPDRVVDVIGGLCGYQDF
jgi:hypothetical protein